MSKAQSTVIWLGLVMVALNIVIHMGDIKSVIFGGPAPAPAPAPAPTPAAAPGNPPLAPGPLAATVTGTTTPPGVQIV